MQLEDEEVETCADMKETVDIQMGGDYCKMCSYRKLGKRVVLKMREKEVQQELLSVSYLQRTYL